MSVTIDDGPQPVPSPEVRQVRSHVAAGNEVVHPPLVKHYPPETRLAMKAGKKIQFCPWIASSSMTTSFLVTDLMFSLGIDQLDPDHDIRRAMSHWAERDRVVYVMDHQGCLLSTYTKRSDIGEVWRVSLASTDSSRMHYGTAVFGGPATACHFQIVGKQTFATCHSRRFVVGVAPPAESVRVRWVRWIPVPRQPNVRMSLLILNYQEGLNRIAVARIVDERPRQGVTFELPQWGSRMVTLDRLIERGGGEQQDLFRVAATAECDFYTVFQNVEEPSGPLSIQHIK